MMCPIFYSIIVIRPDGAIFLSLALGPNSINLTMTLPLNAMQLMDKGPTFETLTRR